MSIPNATRQQKDIFRFVRHGKGSAVVIAVPGAGKTTTLEHAVRYVPDGATTAFVCFGKDIERELSRRMKQATFVGTVNSVGYRAIKLYWTTPDIHRDKVKTITRSVCGSFSSVDRKHVEQLVKLAKHYAISTAEDSFTTTARLTALAESFSITPHRESTGSIVCGAIQVLEVNNATRSVIDFDDQVYFPVIFDLPLPGYDFVMADEAQDFSVVQRRILERMVREGGRLLAVGDPNQAIYAFRGADSDSMGMLQRQFRAQSLPLTVSFRCPTKVVELARGVFPEITASSFAEPGHVRHETIDWSNLKAHFSQPSLVVCRQNAPLVDLSFGLTRQGIPTRIRGLDVAKSIMRLIQALDAASVPQLVSRMDKWRRNEQSRAAKAGDDGRASRANDYFETLQAMITWSQPSTIDRLKWEIRKRFAASADRVVLTTVHRAKGLEHRRVIIYRPDLMPSEYARSDWAKQQERNLEYVAYTRSKNELIFLHDDLQEAA